MRHVKHIEVNGKKVRQSACIALNGPPNAATEGRVGSLAIDTSSAYHEVYKCVAVEGCIHTWELLASGNNGGSGTGDGTGKSAYEYAQDGGYTGTEGQFAMLLANAVDKRNISIGLHTDGRIYLFMDGESIGNGVALPSGTSGDVVGNVDSGNNIVLSGNLANGTYILKYQMSDGTTIDIGEFEYGGSSGGNSGSGGSSGDTSDSNLFTSAVRAAAVLNRRRNSSGVLMDADGVVSFKIVLPNDISIVDNTYNANFIMINREVLVANTTLQYSNTTDATAPGSAKFYLQDAQDKPEWWSIGNGVSKIHCVSMFGSCTARSVFVSLRLSNSKITDVDLDGLVVTFNEVLSNV